MAIFKKGSYIIPGNGKCNDLCILLREDYDTKVGGPFNYVNHFTIWDYGHGKMLIEKDYMNNDGGYVSPLFCGNGHAAHIPPKQIIEVCDHLLKNDNLKWGKIRKGKISYEE